MKKRDGTEIWYAQTAPHFGKKRIVVLSLSHFICSGVCNFEFLKQLYDSQ